MSLSNPRERSLIIPGPAGNLEAIESKPLNEPKQVIAIICHPHPLYGGTMQNKVVTTLARAFNEEGIVAIRFNYRGVGASQGCYGSAVGETEDLHAIISWVKQHYPTHKIWLAGFSFGSYIVLNALKQQIVAGLITVAPAVQHFDFTEFRSINVPWLLIQGDQDEIVPAQEVIAWAESRQTKPELVVMPEVTHFFHGHLQHLRDTVKHFLGKYVLELT